MGIASVPLFENFHFNSFLFMHLSTSKAELRKAKGYRGHCVKTNIKLNDSLSLVTFFSILLYLLNSFDNEIESFLKYSSYTLIEVLAGNMNFHNFIPSLLDSQSCMGSGFMRV